MKYLQILLYVVVLTILQVFFLQRMWNGIYISVYIAVVILMDIKTPKWIVLLTGFASGGLIDLISAGAGLNAAVTGFVALCRYPILRLTLPNNVIEEAGPILTDVVSPYKFMLYVSIMLLIWSVSFFFIESSFTNPLWSLINVLINVVFGTLIITFIQLPIHK